MKRKLFYLILIMALAVCGSFAYGQGRLEVGPKRPRTLEDYKPGTLKEIELGDMNSPALLPFRVTVTYTASLRAISSTNNNALNDWARCCAGNPDHYKSYIREMRFVENGEAHWLVVDDGLIADFQRELKIGETVDLFLIRLSPPDFIDKRVSILLVERFQKAGTNSDEMKQPLNWIASNFPSYAEKDMKVELPGSCQLKITDSVNSASVSKAVLFLPLIDLDISKVSVQPQQNNDTWGLWLHTTAGKNSIRFMLYQGGPAEGGQASNYSLTFRDREKAEAMAEAFRRAINLCVATKFPND